MGGRGVFELRRRLFLSFVQGSDVGWVAAFSSCVCVWYHGACIRVDCVEDIRINVCMWLDIGMRPCMQRKTEFGSDVWAWAVLVVHVVVMLGCS